MINTLVNALEKVNINLNEKQKSQFSSYFKLLVEWNEKINLTAITEPQDVAIKHFYDSITFLLHTDLKQGAKVIDVGTGAGFPGIPLKILRPDIELTLLDSLNKRLIFLQEVCDSINIDAELIHKRAEEAGRDNKLREKFDVATSRAVANMNTLSEYCLPLVKVGGKFVAMKGKNGKEELEKAKNAIKILSGQLNKIDEFTLPIGDERTIIVVDKIKVCPKQYPRQSGKIKNSPLV
jgi:16S rRNA (guanine527-N7)-methyltransferase